ncbi:trehalose-phosphatase [Mycolicibacterium psychrotolerans]|uniref:Putative glycosyl hydrolase n=1 Tax=Mycolicibacterium psychrotolerans TaxID=216929 RepID=A0A7I7MJC3_9MYCO|nr:trehalose-phosphatase [Mycolicibacterium psychrotolerans]BBX71359.1 putative glycosyl hydrolase [Mycolicibacterium psychrotolerans]
MSLPVFVDPRYHDAVIFDLDGVVTDTAALHAAAWRATLDDYLQRRGARAGEDHSPLTDDDCRVLADPSRGVAEVLASRGVTLPPGGAEDPHDGTVEGLQHRQQQLFAVLLADGVGVFESTVDLVRTLAADGIAAAVYSRNPHSARVLYAAGLTDSFAAKVDDVPPEDLLLEAARRVGVHPGRCVAVDTTAAGVSAGRDGGFALVIGVDRTGRGDELLRRGADVVIADLVAVSVRDSFRRTSEMADALQSYSEVAGLLEIRRPVVMLDYDGTLSEIVGEPASATLVSGADKALEALAARCPVAIISGRSLADIQARVDVPGLWYAGSHGFELTAPDGTRHVNEAGAAAVHDLQDARDELRQRLASVDGLFIEDKRFSVAVHYRGVAPDRVDEVMAVVRILGQRHHLRVTGGRKVIELRPDVEWGKGRTIEWILEHIGGADLLLPMYIGDDLTDEDGFDAIRHKGVGIAVRSAETGDRRSSARLTLAGPEAVCDFLGKIVEQLTVQHDSLNDPWVMTFGGYQPESERLREALCTMGNGYLAVRGAAPECGPGEFHYPGTYVAGIYNRLTDTVAGVTIDNESMVNLPNWLALAFRIDGGPWFDIDDVDVSSYLVTLDLRRAVLSREFLFTDADGRSTRVRQRRFVAMHQPHVAALQTTVEALNWSGQLEFRSLVDGAVTNQGVDRYRDLASRHLEIVGKHELSQDSVLLAAETVESGIVIAVAVRNRLADGGAPAHSATLTEEDRIGHRLTADLNAGQSATVEKVVCVFTSRDHGISGPVVAAERELQRAGDFAALEHGHRMAWAHLWERFNVEMGRDADLLRIVRLYQLHLLQTLSPHTADLDVGVPARGLHGEAYRGHVFWDELFVFPVTNLRLPKVTRSLLMYRYRRLPEARRAALAAGHVGAMFPWQSGSDGREESQRLHLNPKSGHWNPDASARAHHIGLAIAYNVWQHYQVTGDIGFLIDYGAEMLAEISRFWVRLAEFDDDRQRYVIRGVIGPDEFHSGYPGKEYDGIDNNAYSNVLAVWVIARTLEALERIPMYYRLALLESLGIDDDELARWDDVSRRMFVPFHDGVISQFEGYEKLAELDWAAYRARYENMQRLDRILEAENDSPNNYKASKQADALMLFYLLSADELYELFERLGYQFTPDQIPATIDYYQARTSHGSTLSAVVHAWVVARGNRAQAMEYFAQALASDVVDTQQGTTAEGIHLAAMTGSIDLLQRCFTGLEIRRDRIVLGPLWPKALGRLEFTFRYRGHRLRLSVIGRSATLSAELGDALPVLVECRGLQQTLLAGGTVEFDQ